MDEDSISCSEPVGNQELWQVSHTIVQVSVHLAGRSTQICRLRERPVQRNPEYLT